MLLWRRPGCYWLVKDLRRAVQEAGDHEFTTRVENALRDGPPGWRPCIPKAKRRLATGSGTPPKELILCWRSRGSSWPTAVSRGTPTPKPSHSFNPGLYYRRTPFDPFPLFVSPSSIIPQPLSPRVHHGVAPLTPSFVLFFVVSSFRLSPPRSWIQLRLLLTSWRRLPRRCHPPPITTQRPPPLQSATAPTLPTSPSIHPIAMLRRTLVPGHSGCDAVKSRSRSPP